jgi:nitric oxide reductase subunit B
MTFKREVGAGDIRPFLLSRGWIQAAILVFLFGFFILGLLAFRNYGGQPPIPDRVVDESG